MIKGVLLAVFFILSFIQPCIADKKPNIILILADDMGYSDAGSYGGEIKTPNIDRLAKEGIRYQQFYNASRCCPSRTALMTGLYPHEAGMGWMAAADLGTYAYHGNLNNDCVTIAEVLKNSGYHTYMSGKWHLTNERKIDGAVTDNWPHQRGFDRYFGIIPGGANYYTPFVYSNNTRYKAPKDFYLTNAISDTSVQFLREHFTKAKGEPFFMYVAYTAPHWPLHAPDSVINRYKDIYKAGWDSIRARRFAKQVALGVIPATTVLSPRDSTVPAWNTLSTGEQQEMAMRMAIYAAQIDIMDQGIGRIVQTLKANNELDNTLILFLSDNGACAEFISSGKSKEVNGQETTFESYRINWANVSSTPFREYKHFTHEGGIATPLIVHWPKGIDPNLNNTFIRDYGHITDIMATCTDVTGAVYPAIYKGHKIHPLEGKSLVPNFKGNPNNRGLVFWEHEANIAVRDGKWKLVAKTEEDHLFDPATLQLYNMEEDPSEMYDLSKKEPGRLQKMYALWKAWADRVGVFPFDTREYGARMQAYRKQINGEFDDNLGGWNVKITEPVTGTIHIDTTSRLSGEKSALIAVEKPGRRPADMALFWPFRALPGEQYKITVTAAADHPVSFYTRLENVNEPGKKLMDQVVQANKGKQTIELVAQPVSSEGTYRVAFYFGTVTPGTKLWLDGIQLSPVSPAH